MVSRQREVTSVAVGVGSGEDPVAEADVARPLDHDVVLRDAEPLVTWPIGSRGYVVLEEVEFDRTDAGADPLALDHGLQDTKLDGRYSSWSHGIETKRTSAAMASRGVLHDQRYSFTTSRS
jgi:hypothetical protein